MGAGQNEILNEETCQIIYLDPKEEKKDETDFWLKEKNKLKIYLLGFLNKLAQSGFRIYRTGLNYTFVQVNDNVVEEIHPRKMKDSIKKFLMDPDQEFEEGINGHMILGKVMEKTYRLFSRGFLEFLENLKGDFKRDTPTESFIYFNNCYVEVTKDNYTIHDYKDLDKYVWRDQVIKRNFHPSEQESDFRKFVMQICRFDEKRFNALRSAIGYLLHTYKDPANAKAIIFMDEKIDIGANGGSGKSLLGVAISKVRKSLILDGNNFRFDRFSYQSYRPGTQILEFNDTRKNFPFRQIYTEITDYMVVERKNRDQVIIPFKDTPKILITSNYAILGEDDSTLRRQFVIEFSDYYNRKYTPMDEFGRMFFIGWSQEDWDSFYSFMIDCLQYFLKNGLMDYDRGNLSVKKLTESTSPEFIEFMEFIETDKWYAKREIYEKFIEEYPDYKNGKLRQQLFTRWIMIYAKINNFIFEQKRTGDVRKFIIRKLSSVD